MTVWVRPSQSCSNRTPASVHHSFLWAWRDEKRVRGIIWRERSLSLKRPSRALLARARRGLPANPRQTSTTSFREHYAAVKQHIADPRRRERRAPALIGACFTMEYAIESASLFNPSMVQASNKPACRPARSSSS